VGVCFYEQEEQDEEPNEIILIPLSLFKQNGSKTCIRILDIEIVSYLN
jgi:hypothetical protein